MSFVKRLRDYLKKNKIEYVSYYHSPAYTLNERAKCLGVKRNDLAKTVLVKTKDGYAIVILPASRKINFSLLTKAINKKILGVASNSEFKKLFPDCELGAIPAFGNLYGIPVYAASVLDDGYKIVFNAGTHTNDVKMSFRDFKNLVSPQIVKFSEPRCSRFSH